MRMQIKTSNETHVSQIVHKYFVFRENHHMSQINSQRYNLLEKLHNHDNFFSCAIPDDQLPLRTSFSSFFKSRKSFSRLKFLLTPFPCLLQITVMVSLLLHVLLIRIFTLENSLSFRRKLSLLYQSDNVACELHLSENYPSFERFFFFETCLSILRVIFKIIWRSIH